LWFLFRVIRDTNKRDELIAALFIAGLMVSHNLTAYMGIGFISIWVIFWICVYKKGVKGVLRAGMLGLGLSAFFWLPAFMTRSLIWVSYLQAGRFQILDGLLHGSLWEIFIPTFIPMIINWTAIVLPFIAWWGLWKNSTSHTARYGANVIGILFTTALFFMTGLSKPIWDVFFPILYIFQFPWRFLTMMTIFGSLLTGGLVYLLPHRRLIILIGICVIFVYANIANFRPLSYEFVDKYRPQDPCGTSWGFEYLPVWVKTCLKTSWDKPYRVMSGDAAVIHIDDPHSIILYVTAKSKSVLQIGQYAYPGWQAFIDEKSVSISHENENGLIEILIPEGVHQVRIVLKHTSIEQWSNIVSCVALIFVLGGFAREYIPPQKRSSRIKKV